MTAEERAFVETLLTAARASEHILRRELSFTRSRRKRHALADALVAVMADRRRCEEALRG